MGRQSNHGIRSDDGPCCRRRKVILPDMHALGIRQPGDVRTVVDDEDATTRQRQIVELVGKLQKRPSGECLGTKLNDTRAALQTGGRQIDRRPACSSGDIHVDYRVKTVGTGLQGRHQRENAKVLNSRPTS
jgi:hypothetical protein